MSTSIVALVVVVAGAGVFAILFVQMVSNRILSRLGALVVFAAGMLLGALVLPFCCGCASFIPRKDMMMIEWFQSHNRMVDTLK